MLLEGMRRTGFRPLRPEISASEPPAITKRATIRKARSEGIPKRRSAKLNATKMSASPIGRKTSPTPTFVALEEISAPRSRTSARTSDSSICTKERVCSASSPRSSSVGRIGLAHLPDQQPYQAGDGDGAPRVLLNPRLDITLHSGEFVLRDRGGLRQAVPGRTHDANHLLSRGGDLFLSEIGNRLGQFCDVFTQTRQIGNRTGIGHFLCRVLRAAPC